MKDKKSDVVVTNLGNSFRFQFGGVFFDLPTGESSWPYDIADHLRRKFRGVTAAVRNAAPQEPVASPQVAAPAVLRMRSKAEREADEKIAQRKAEEAAAVVAPEPATPVLEVGAATENVVVAEPVKNEAPEPPASN